MAGRGGLGGGEGRGGMGRGQGKGRKGKKGKQGGNEDGQVEQEERQ